MIRRAVTLVSGLALAVAVETASRPAFAQDIAAAESLFREGKALLDKGDYEAACGKLAESQRLDPSSGTLLNLAACHEKEGKVATAWAEYLAAARLAETQGKTERIAEAKRRAAELERRLSYLTIRVAAPVAGIEIRRDEVVLEAESIGSKIPVDPGKHVVAVSAPGYESVSLDVTLGESGDSQTLLIPALEPAPSPPANVPAAPPSTAPSAAPATPAPSPPASSSTAPNPPPATRTAGHGNTLAWVIGGAGAAIAVTGGVFGILALSAYSDANKACPSHSNCSEDALSSHSKAETRANVANVGVSLGLVGVAVGVVMLVTGGKDSEKDSSHATLAPELGPHDASVTLSGVF